MHISHLRSMAVNQLAELIAARRARRGRSWLNRHAPPCWYRNFYQPQPDGTALFRANCLFEDDCPLALAFESQAHLAGNDGYVTGPTVVRHFQLEQRWVRAHGFGTSEDLMPFGCEVQNAAWDKLLRNMPEGSTAFRHRTPLDKRFAEMSFEDEGSPTFLGNFRRRLRAAWG